MSQQSVRQATRRAVGRAGIIGLSEAAALDYADQGIQIDVIAPCPILTESSARRR
jgi:NAD(P)-dependent dehydrogenase (short-subunit alcohol dehydrogenase family)